MLLVISRSTSLVCCACYNFLQLTCILLMYKNKTFCSIILCHSPKEKTSLEYVFSNQEIFCGCDTSCSYILCNCSWWGGQYDEGAVMLNFRNEPSSKALDKQLCQQFMFFSGHPLSLCMNCASGQRNSGYFTPVHLRKSEKVVICLSCHGNVFSWNLFFSCVYSVWGSESSQAEHVTWH